MKRDPEKERRLAEALRDNLRKRKAAVAPAADKDKPKPDSER